jgi:hypothetical protein
MHDAGKIRIPGGLLTQMDALTRMRRINGRQRRAKPRVPDPTPRAALSPSLRRPMQRAR